MFFTISPRPDYRLPNHVQFGNWYFSCDNGWNKTSTGWIKGYHHADISNGNFLKIDLVENEIHLSHPLSRSCPLWWNADENTLTSLLGSGQIIWANEYITLTDYELIVEKIDIFKDINLEEVSMESAVDYIANNLINKFEELRKNFPSKPKIFVSGGVDTVTLLSVAKYTGINLEILDYEYFEYDLFTNKNQMNIANRHWGYNQIHHWRSPSLLISGAYGDEFLFRGPSNIALWSAWNDIDLLSVIASVDGYHTNYFKKPSNEKIFREEYERRTIIKNTYPNYSDLIKAILEVNVNDHQHWHLGNTLTWTPFLDLELTKMILRLSQTDLLDHVINATVNKKIINLLYPELLKIISKRKNYNSREYLHLLK